MHRDTGAGGPQAIYPPPAVATYRFFNLLLSSELPLPELRRDDAGEPAVAVRQMRDGQLDEQAFETRYEWRDPRGALICRCGRNGSGYLLSLPAQASFHLAASGTIGYRAEAGIEQDLLRQLLLNQVLPRYLSHAGELLVHASAVTLPGGRTVAFLGDSGFGKSTLASCCHLHGAQLIDDDCISLSADSRGVCVSGGVPTLRLYPDSLRALGLNAGHFAPYAKGSDKLQMQLADSAPVLEARRLDALYLLDAPSRTRAGGEVCLEPAGGQAAMMAILGSAFSLDPSDVDTQARTFRQAAQTLAGRLPVYWLRYPREHGALPRVLRALLDGEAG
ncbi:MAG: hypothetical protein KDI17_06005 [Halioglobus sp.]|nr:hypothetical protein [Halioglobus sp.]